MRICCLYFAMVVCSSVQAEALSIEWKRFTSASCTGPEGWLDPNFDNNGWEGVSPALDESISIERDWFLRGRVTVPVDTVSATLFFSSDDGLKIWVDGDAVGEWGNGCHGEGCVNLPFICSTNDNVPPLDVTAFFPPGEHVIAVHVSNAAVSASSMFFDLALDAGLSGNVWKRTPFMVEECDCPVGWMGVDFDDSSWEETALPKNESEPRAGVRCYRRKISLPTKPVSAILSSLESDDGLKIWVNGELVFEHGECYDLGCINLSEICGENSIVVAPINITAKLNAGVNVITAKNINGEIAFSSMVLNLRLNIQLPPDGEGPFTFNRGDANDDGKKDITDAVAVLEHLFLGGSLGCREAGNANADSNLDITDAVHLLECLFLGGECPPQGCITIDTSLFGCDEYNHCPQGS